ncbi:type IX secretion system motor protein PorL/GldL [Segatella sp.]
MSYYSKFNIVYRLQKWMDSVPGQTFLNYAYSWGASIVIAGTLFKLTHLPGANLMLFLGMGTEIFVFFLSAFDRPFDKTAEGRDLPTHATEEYLEGKVSAEEMMTARKQPETVQPETVQPEVAAPVSPVMAAAPELTPLNPEVVEVQNSYVEQLKNLVETLSKVNEQSSRLTRDSEEMENLNRTLTGISRVYEMQLKSASQQIGTIDQINEQTKMMAKQIEQLNKIYTRMIDAMTINMRVAAPHVTSEE